MLQCSQCILLRYEVSVHGISVGARYDPDSLFFNKPCICDEDWIGELCDVPTADQVMSLVSKTKHKIQTLSDL